MSHKSRLVTCLVGVLCFLVGAYSLATARRWCPKWLWESYDSKFVGFGLFMLSALGFLLVLMTVFMPEEWESKKRES